jgi:hypothetical protein
MPAKPVNSSLVVKRYLPGRIKASGECIAGGRKPDVRKSRFDNFLILQTVVGCNRVLYYME